MAKGNVGSNRDDSILIDDPELIEDQKKFDAIDKKYKDQKDA